MKQSATIVLSILAVTAGLEQVSAEDPNSEKPNILVIFIDDMGFADPSCRRCPFAGETSEDRSIREVALGCPTSCSLELLKLTAVKCDRSQ